MPARKDIFALAQLNAAGYDAAMAIIFKMIEKEIDGTPYDTSASGFVHTCCKNAFESINEYSWVSNKRQRHW